ncbi:MAG: response regulator [Acidobacteriaceae bacterium]
MSQLVAPGSQHVYIVDDEWAIAETLAAVLAHEGFQAHAFHNPGQALVRAMTSPPDILIADVMMPGMTGIEMAIALRRAGHNGRILLFSGQAASSHLLAEARRRGYDFELLEKPIHPMQLLLRIRNVPERLRRRRKTPTDEFLPASGSSSLPAA